MRDSDLVIDAYNRAARLTDAEMADAAAAVGRLGPSGRRAVADSIGLYGKPTAAAILERIADRRGAAIRRRLLGRPGVV